MPTIKVFKDGDQIDEIPISSGLILIGRDPSCQVTLEEDLVSRQHAQLIFQDGTWILRDLKSENGVYVNGGREYTRIITQVDKLQVGSFILVLSNFDSFRPDEDSEIEDGLAMLNELSNMESTEALSARELMQLRKSVSSKAGAYLEIQEPRAPGQKKKKKRIEPLEAGIVQIGRSSSCRIVLSELGFLQGKVAQIGQRSDGAMEIKKISPIANLKVNGKVIKEKVLNEGDTIEIGPYLLRFQLGIKS